MLSVAITFFKPKGTSPSHVNYHSLAPHSDICTKLSIAELVKLLTNMSLTKALAKQITISINHYLTDDLNEGYYHSQASSKSCAADLFEQAKDNFAKQLNIVFRTWRDDLFAHNELLLEDAEVRYLIIINDEIRKKLKHAFAVLNLVVLTEYVDKFALKLVAGLARRVVANCLDEVEAYKKNPDSRFAAMTEAINKFIDQVEDDHFILSSDHYDDRQKLDAFQHYQTSLHAITEDSIQYHESLPNKACFSFFFMLRKREKADKFNPYTIFIKYANRGNYDLNNFIISQYIKRISTMQNIPDDYLSRFLLLKEVKHLKKVKVKQTKSFTF